MRSYLQSGALMKALVGLAALVAVTQNGGVQAQTVTLDNVSPIALTTSSTQTAVRIDPQTGNVTVRTQAGNYNSCSAPPPTSPTINSFFPTSATVAPGANITLNWTSSNTVHCTPQLGSGTTWASLGQLPVSGSQVLVAPGTQGNITFQLTCTDGVTSDIETTQVNVTTGPPPSCSPLYPNGTTSEWNQVVNVWPAFGVRPRIMVPPNGYVALRFTTTAIANQFGTISGLEFPGDGDGAAQMSISRDPGCFTPGALGPNCLVSPSRTPSIGWSNAQAQFSCTLGTGQSWHVNVTFGNSTQVNGSTPYCPAPGGTCGVDLINQIQD